MVDHHALQRKKLFLFDLDGTLYLGEQLCPGVTDLLAHIRQSGGGYRFLTNNSSRSVDAYVHRDTVLAQEVIARDDVVDEDFKRVKDTLIQWIAHRPDDGEYALDLLMIAKYFERIGDHAVNIAEWVVFAVTGVHKEEDA